MNIFGEGFPEEITKQVAVRQKAYGSGYAKGTSRTPDEIAFLNANTSWCKLMSSVNIKNPELVNSQTVKDLAKNGLGGDELAKRFVLLNGTSTYNRGTMYPRSGISDTNNLLGGDNAYGIGGTEFGLRPMMGITHVSVNHENRGSLRRAEVKIKAFNRAQFEIIDMLYLRLGFSVLLEWGNTMYFDKDGAFQKNESNSLDYIFLNGAYSYDEVLRRIHQQRLDTAGNYDAMFAKVTNFHWSFMPDGSYDITVNLSSVGDIIESLKVNVLLESDGKFTSIKDEKEAAASTADLSTNDLIDLYASKHTIGSFLYFLKFQLSNISGELNLKADLIPDWVMSLASSTLPEDASVGARIKVTTPEDANSYVTSIPLISSQIQKQQNAAINSVNTMYSGSIFGISSINELTEVNPNVFDKGHIDAVSIKWDNYKDEWQYYVRLGTFLQFIQNVVMVQMSQDNITFIPGLKFDFEPGTNLMYVDPLQISVDPRICVVNKTLKMLDVTTSYGLFTPDFKIENTDFVYAPGCEPFIFQDIKTAIPDTDYGDIMNIYLNFTFILNKIDELKDDKNKVSLIDFLQGLLQGANTALGGINNLDVFIDETTNTVKVIDKNPLPNLDKVIDYYKGKGTTYKSTANSSLTTTPAFFELYGYNGNDPAGSAGFIKDFSFTTELTPEFSTMITVGAAANGTVVGENDTALSKLNRGLEDRYKKTVTNGSLSKTSLATLTATSVSASKEYEELNTKLGKVYAEYTNFLKTLSPTKSDWFDTLQELNVDEVDTYKDTLTNIIQLKQQITKVQEKIDAISNPSKPPTASPGTGFIPFNLSLTMDGLSGMKINQQFTIDTSYLPSNYPNTVKFLIKNISHEIANNKWYTKLESYCIATGTLSENTNANITPKGQSTSTNPSPTPPPTPNPVPSPDWSKYNVGQTPTLKQAVKDQSTYVYSKGIYSPMNGLKTPTGFGEIPGRCAGYTYNMAYKLKDYITSKSSKALSFAYHAAGDANSDVHRQNILNLGIYDMYYLGDYKASELKNGFVSKFKWNYGDILNYYAPGFAPPHNMHSQMYTGDIWVKGINGSGVPDAAGSQGWSTSGATNYGAQFVYKSSDLVFKVYAFKVKPEYLK